MRTSFHVQIKLPKRRTPAALKYTLIVSAVLAFMTASTAGSWLYTSIRAWGSSFGHHPSPRRESIRKDAPPVGRPTYEQQTLSNGAGETTRKNHRIEPSAISQLYRDEGATEAEVVKGESIGERKEVFRTVPLKDLTVSPEFLKRLEREDVGGREEGNRSGGGAMLGGGGSSLPGKEEKPDAREHALDPFSCAVRSFVPGRTKSGKSIRPIWDIMDLNSRVLGPPDYSLDTKLPALDRLLSLGNGGEIVLEVVGGDLADGPGADFVVFENPFIINGSHGKEVYVETAYVSVATVDSPEDFRDFPCAKDEPPYRGCAGVTPVRYASELPLVAVGGDQFDLASVGLPRARIIRLRDTGDNESFLEGTEGFDLDAVALIHTSY